jgi:hypothetical protein
MANKYKAPAQNQFVPVGFIVDNMFKGGSHAISLSYSDQAGAIGDNTPTSKQVGRVIDYVSAKDDKGRDIKKRFRFDQSIGVFKTRPADRDIYGRSQYEFLKNHPECEHSPNGIYEDTPEGKRIQVGVTFRELDSAKDAAVALKASRLRIKAEVAAGDLDDNTLEEIANITGYFGEVDDLMKLKVLEFARSKPAEFDELLRSDDRGVRAIIRIALKEGIFRKVNNTDMIKWADWTVGSNEDDAVATLRFDKEKLEALQAQMKLDVVDTKPKPKK